MAMKNHTSEDDFSRDNEKRILKEYENFFELSDQVLIILNLQGKFDIINQQLIDLSGYSKEELINSSFQNIIHPEDKNTFINTLTNIQLGYNELKIETRLVNKNNNHYWIEWDFKVNVSKNKIYGTGRNITEIKKSEEENSINTKKIFERVFENNLDTILLTKPSGEILLASPTACKMFGRNEKEICEIGQLGLLDGNEYRLELKNKNGLDILYGEFSFIRKDGSLFIGAVHSHIIDEIMGENNHLVFIRDISEIKKATQELSLKQQQLQLFIKHSPAAIAIFDTEMTYLATSEKWLRDYNLLEESIIGKTHYEIFPSTPQRWKDIQQYCLNGASEKSDEDLLVHPDGTTNCLKWEIHPWYNSLNEIGGIIIMTDVINDKTVSNNKTFETEETENTLFELLYEPVCILDTNFKIVDCNHLFCELIGFNTVELIGQEFRSFFSKKSNNNYSIKNLIENSLNYKCEQSLLNKTGDIISLTITTKKIGQYGFYLILNDSNSSFFNPQNTFLKENINLTSEEDFQEINQETEECISIADLFGQYVFVNQAFCNLIGYSEDELLQMSVYDLKVPEENMPSRFKEAVSKKLVSILRTRLLCKDNTIIYTEIRGKVLKFNNNEFVIGIIKNVTKYLENELVLPNTNGFDIDDLNDINFQNTSIVGSWETNLFNFSVKWSAETYNIFELDSKTFKPTHELFLGFVHPDDLAMTDEAFLNSLNNKNFNFVEHRIITGKGNLKYIEEHWKTIFNEKGVPITAFGSCHDITERKKAELTLVDLKLKATDNEFRLNLAAESAKLGIWDWDIRKNIIVCNDTIFDIYGIKHKSNREDMNTWLERIHPDDREKTNANINDAIKGIKSYDTTFRVIKTNGTVAYIKADAEVLCDKLGNSVRMIGINRDITEQKLADDRLLNNKKRLLKILEDFPIASALSDKTNTINFLNKRFTELFGYTKNDLKNLDRWWILAYPDENYRDTIKKDWFNRLEQAKLTKTSFMPMEAKICCKDGTFRYIELHLAVIEDEYLVNFNDITERIHNEEKLALSALIINSSEDAIISKSVNGIVTSWNHGAEKLLGYSSEEIIGKPYQILIPPEFHYDEFHIINELKKGKSIYNYETKRNRKNGTQIDVSLTASSILDANGKIRGVSKILRDITYQKKLELESEKTIKDLLQRNRDLEQFSYIISHNLRSPVATIIGLINLLNNSKLNASDKKKTINGINISANNLDEVIKDLNVILQVKSQNNEQKKLIKFSELLNDIKSSFNDHIINENVQIISNFKAIDEIETLKSYMYSIFYNLILNSIKYRRANVRPIIEIKSELTGNDLILKFKDNGIGIDLEKYGHEVFGLNKRFNFNTEGKGLGLFMVKTQIESMGGKITLESALNIGTTFKIKFENYLKMIQR